MGAFTLDIRGQLNSIRLGETKALWPLFEAVVNSIHSIEDSPNAASGKITIYAQREEQIQDPLKEREILGKFESFQIIDNGVGFNEANYRSFNTAYSTFKIRKGCKGIGRFLWLKAFASVAIESVFSEDNQYFKREFSFTSDGISPDKDNTTIIDKQNPQTIITLNGFLNPYRNQSPVELDAIAKKIIEHCLLFFVSNKCPEIIISDRVSQSINLNDYFNANIKDSLHQDPFSIKDNEFVLYHLKLPEGASSHELHFCANMQEVTSCDLKKHIPDLHRKILPTDDPIGFYYVGYLTGQYLDSIVNTTRTDFDYDEKNGQTSISWASKDEIATAALDYINLYLSDYISDINRKKRKQIDDFVDHSHPAYRYLLNARPQVYDKIPSGLKLDALELELHKEVQIWETEIKLCGQQLEKAARENVAYTDVTYQKLFETYWSGVTEISKTCLAEYVTRRKTLLTILEETLTIQDDGKFKKEDAIHSIICPMRHTSDEVEFEEMNLWIIDERLAYHRFLASDKTLKSLPDVESNSTKEIDIAVFDRAFAFSDDESPLNTITIIEFKKPDNKKDNPLSQMGRYIDEIVAGQKKRANGLSFGASKNTSFRCFAICDMSSKMEALCKDAGFRLTPDGMGYYGYQPERNAYYEVISYPKLLVDAKKRNQVLFDKLFSPQINQVIHLPKTQNDNQLDM